MITLVPKLTTPLYSKVGGGDTLNRKTIPEVAWIQPGLPCLKQN